MSFGCGGGGGVDGAIGSINKEETAAGGSSSSTTDEVDVDSYAIIPASTLFTHIVPTVLRKLGYSDDIIFSANGTVPRRAHYLFLFLLTLLLTR